MKHPFSHEDIEAAVSMFCKSTTRSTEGFIEDILRAAWESAEDRGAIRWHGAPTPTSRIVHYPCAVIKLPEDKDKQ